MHLPQGRLQELCRPLGLLAVGLFLRGLEERHAIFIGKIVVAGEQANHEHQRLRNRRQDFPLAVMSVASLACVMLDLDLLDFGPALPYY